VEIIILAAGHNRSAAGTPGIADWDGMEATWRDARRLLRNAPQHHSLYAVPSTTGG